MKSYVPVTFAFLGVAFFQLSGGADYVPRDGSLQAAAARLRAAPMSETTFTKSPRRPPVVVERAAASASDIPAVVTRAAMRIDTIGVPPRTAQTAQVKASPPLSAPQGTITDSTADRLEGYSLARLSPAPLIGTSIAPTAEPPAAKDIRSVLKARVNMRMGPGTGYDVVTKLDRGAAVELLQAPGNGWIKLRVIETGRIGWMSETLVSAAN